MSFLERPDKSDRKYGENSFIKRDLYIKDLESYCTMIEDRLIVAQEDIDKLLLRIEAVNKHSWT